METLSGDETTREALFAEADEILRRLAIEKEKCPADSPNIKLYSESIRMAERVLAWRRRFAAVAPQPNREIEDENEQTQVLQAFDPTERYLDVTRRDLLRHYEHRVSPDVRDWLKNWTQKAEGAVQEKNLLWVSQAVEALQQQKKEWSSFVSVKRGRSLGILGKLRARKLHKLYRLAEAEAKELDARIVAEQARLSRHLNKTRILAGMLSVFLKVQSGCTAIEHRILKKVLELDRERDLRRYLEHHVTELKQHLVEIQEQRERVRKDREELLSQRSKMETRKQMRLLEIYSRTEVDPCELVMQATEIQINKTYAQVEHLIREELNEVELREKHCHKLESEFNRLVGVVHEYQKATKSADGKREEAAGNPAEARSSPSNSGGVVRH